MPSPFKECQSDGIYTCSFCMYHGTVNCPPKTDRSGDEATSQNLVAGPSRVRLNSSAVTETPVGL